MSIAHDVAKLMAARHARLVHQALITARPIDKTTRLARLAAILNNPDPTNPRRARIVEIFTKARSRADHRDTA